MIHAVGAVGMVLVVGAYVLVSAGRIGARSAAYQVMNLVGALALVGYSVVLGAWASVALNLVWAAIAAVALARLGWASRSS